jgi:hypothetical protein
MGWMVAYEITPRLTTSTHPPHPKQFVLLEVFGCSKITNELLILFKYGTDNIKGK